MNCIFCDILDKKIPAKIIAENDGAIAFLDVQPISDGHTIVIPKKHHKNLSECSAEDLNYVTSLVKEVANILMFSKLKPWGFNYISNEGSVAGQEVMHFHMHVIPKYAKREGLSLTMGAHCVEDIETTYKHIMKAAKPLKSY
jgi:histidine triad (HIT) family protein